MFENLCELTSQGGCSCKLNPGLLREVLKGLAFHQGGRIVVDHTTQDDAAVIRADALFGEGLAVLSTDFQLAPVEDPFESGLIVAANAISDVYAMGARPVATLVMMGLPVARFRDPAAVGRAMMDGIRTACEQCGIAIVGGHTIDSAEPILGLAVFGTVSHAGLKTNGMALPGDDVVLTKPIGSGIVMTGRKLDLVDDELYREAVRTMSMINDPGAWLGEHAEVHALTDVTGFGLIGHALEICNASGVSITIESSKVPAIKGAEELAYAGIWPSAALRNLEAAESQLGLDGVSQERKILLADPQTNGGLLFTSCPSRTSELVGKLRSAGFLDTAVIGKTSADASCQMLAIKR